MYFDDQRRTCIVPKLGKTSVHVIRIENEVIEYVMMPVERFTKRYIGRWPAYPLRRAAHLYLDSTLAKTDAALHALRVMLAAA